MKRYATTTLVLAACALAAPTLADKAGHDHRQITSIGKANAPVHLVNRAEIEGALGAVVPVQLQLMITQPADSAQVRISASDGLSIKASVVEYSFENVAPGPLNLPPVDVQIDAAGRHSVTATVSLVTGGQVRGAAMGVAVATPGAKSTAVTADKALVTDARGRALRVLPAVETR